MGNRSGGWWGVLGMLSHIEAVGTFRAIAIRVFHDPSIMILSPNLVGQVTQVVVILFILVVQTLGQ